MKTQHRLSAVFLAGLVLLNGLSNGLWAANHASCQEELDLYTDTEDTVLMCGASSEATQNITYDTKTQMCRAAACQKTAWQGQCLWLQGKIGSTLLCDDTD